MSLRVLGKTPLGSPQRKQGDKLMLKLMAYFSHVGDQSTGENCLGIRRVDRFGTVYLVARSFACVYSCTAPLRILGLGMGGSTAHTLLISGSGGGVLSPLPIIALGKNMMVDFGAGIVVGESPPLALSEVGGGGMGNSCLLRKNQG